MSNNKGIFRVNMEDSLSDFNENRPIEAVLSAVAELSKGLPSSSRLDDEDIYNQIKTGIPYTSDLPILATNRRDREQLLAERKKGVILYGELQRNSTYNVATKSLSVYSDVPAGSTEVFNPYLQRPFLAPSNEYAWFASQGLAMREVSGTMHTTYLQESAIDEPIVSFNNVVDGGIDSQQKNSVTYSKPIRLPIPMIFFDFQLSTRAVNASSNPSSLTGGIFNIEMEEINARAESLYSFMEYSIFWGFASKFTGFGGETSQIQGLANFDYDIIPSDAYNLDATNPLAFVSQLTDACQQLSNNRIAGPYVLFLSQSLQGVMATQPITPTFPVNTLERWIMQNVPFIKEIRYTYFLNPIEPTLQTSNPTGQMVLMQISQKCFDIPVADPVQSVMYHADQKSRKYLLFTAFIPRPKYDINDRAGILFNSITTSNFTSALGLNNKVITYSTRKEANRIKKIRR